MAFLLKNVVIKIVAGYFSGDLNNCFSSKEITFHINDEQVSSDMVESSGKST